ncbi:mycobactin polyketide synthase MbtD [Mycolicibacterium mengxianglii]|uniref:mycobactin polyketide synthase MbtD n=1 Tax=Mycolicibacterium mengxianglii TaxID=2736649 RepID=UPI0018D0B4AA
MNIQWPDGRTPVLLSAHAEELIREDAQAILRYLDQDPRVAAVAAHLARARRIRRYRTAIRAADAAELADALSAVVRGEDHRLVSTSACNAAPRVAFVFPGQGGQFPGMGADAYAGLAVYRREVDRCAAAFGAAGYATPVDYLRTAGDPEAYSEIEVQGAQFAHAVAITEVWRSCGVVPDLTVGHSLGEVAAAYLAEAMTLDEAVAVLGARAAVVDWLSGDYAVAALGITPAAAQQLIADNPGWLELSVVNAAESVAVSGDRSAVNAAVGAVRAQGLLAREITVNFPVHTSVLDPLRARVEQGLPSSRFTEGAVQFIGSVTGDVVPAGTEHTGYWYRNLRSTVRFDRAVESAIRCGATTFIEISNHPALLHAVQDRLEDHGTAPRPSTVVLLGSGQRGQSFAEQLAANIAAAAVADPGYRWRDRLAGYGTDRALRDFPNAPMRTTHLWAGPEPLPPPLTTAAETWLPADLPVATTVRRVAVVALGPGRHLADGMTAALDAHSGAVLTAPAAADLIVAVAPALNDPDVVHSADQLSAAVGSGLFGYLDALGPDCRDVWLLTAGGERTGPADPPPLPAQAALAAMHRSLGFEHPDQRFHHLDLPSADHCATAADVVLAGSGEVALRKSGAGAALYRRELADLPAGLPPAWTLADGALDEVVITGGAGAIGMHYARYFAERGAKRIVLLSRSSVDPATLAELTRRYGVDISSPSCDITDSARVGAVAAEFAGTGASLLIHSAGTATWNIRDQLTAAAVHHTLAAKVTGLATVTAQWPIRADARIMLCSSVIGVWGGKGTAAYAAANRMLDVLAAQLRAQGRRCVAIRWGLWQHSGIVDAAETARVQRAGLLAMTPEAAIEASLYDHVVDPLVFSADPERLARFLGVEHSGVAAPEIHPGTVAPAPAGDAPAEVVRTELAAVLNSSDPAALDLDASLFDLGVDSLLALDLRKRMKHRTGQTVPLAILLGGITGSELISTLANTGPADTQTPAGPESTEGGHNP